MRVCDWMTSHPVAVRASATVREARRLLSYHRVRHLPVTDGGQVVGMLSDEDVRIEEVPCLRSLHEVPGLLGAGRSVSSLLREPAVTIYPDATIEAAADLLLATRVHALAVVDRGRHLVGVLTPSDCLRALLTGQPAAV
jgi:acetoin utilization protein AcuB